MDQLDDIVSAALQALDGTATPRGYFDELPARIDRRMEGSMQTDTERNADQLGMPPSLGTTEGDADGVVAVAAGRDEDSGLHDIKALAKSTRQRLSRRITTQNDVVDSVSASQSGMHAIALPDPAKMISLPSPEEARALAATASSGSMAAATVGTASAREPATITPMRPAPSTSKGVPGWLWAGGGIAAAAAAVVAFVTLGGDKPEAPDKTAAAGERITESKGEQILTEEGPRIGDQIATGRAPAVTPDDKAAAPKADDGMTVSGIVEPGTNSGSGSATAVADTEVDKKTDDRKKKESSGGSSGGGGSSKGSAVGSGSSSSDKGSGKGSSTSSGDDKKKPDGKTKGSGTGSGSGGGAVLGDGDTDELGIGDAIKGGGGSSDDKPAKTELTSKELRAGLDAVSGKAKACYDGAVGTVKVKLTVGSTGKVTKASASGPLAGTPAADCVVAAIKSASFPSWTGAPSSTTYAVLLSD